MTNQASLSTIDRAMSVLSVFSVERPELGVSEIGRAIGLNKVAVHRLLRSLEANGLIEQDEQTKRYRLGYGVLKLASIKLAGTNLMTAAIPHLDALRDRSGETVHLSIMKGAAVLRLYIVQTHHFLRFAADVGDEGPVHCSAAGKLLLAYSDSAGWNQAIERSKGRFQVQENVQLEKLRDELQEIRQRGYAVDDQEYLPFLRAFAAPIRDAGGHVIAAVSMGGPVMRVTDDRVPALIAMIVDTARSVSQALGCAEAA